MSVVATVGAAVGLDHSDVGDAAAAQGVDDHGQRPEQQQEPDDAERDMDSQQRHTDDAEDNAEDAGNEATTRWHATKPVTTGTSLGTRQEPGIVGDQLPFDLGEDTLFVLRQWHVGCHPPDSLTILPIRTGSATDEFGWSTLCGRRDRLHHVGSGQACQLGPGLGPQPLGSFTIQVLTQQCRNSTGRPGCRCQ